MLHRVFGMPKKYIAFFGITGIMLVTAFIKVPCPVCDGTGTISTSVNMDHVFYSNLQTDLKFLNPDFCMGYTLYEYGVNVTLTNDGSEDATGWISLLLKGTLKGNGLDTRYVGVAVPAKKTVVDSFIVWFQTPYDATQDVYIDPGIDQGAVKCLTCSGTGKVPLNVWFMANGIKSSLARITKVETTFEPPPVPQFAWGD